MLNDVTLLGFAAGTLTTLAFIPQIIKSRHSKSTKDLSEWLLIIEWLGIGAWLVYGVFIISYPLVVTNSVTECLITYLLFLKSRHG